MATKTVHLNWNPEEEFALYDHDGFKVAMKPKGVSASDLLPMALAGCSSHDVVSILKKQKLDLRELRVSAAATQDDDPPWRFRKIHLRYTAVGKGIDPEKLNKAILLSQEKYCSVYVTLRDALEITYDYETLEA
ncbi:MAG: OsmC family protein [Chloroflexi bacterium]|nr:OsmC family protein [Chloroflexota bacterium]MCA2001460.1 OsmC family protein [Chloroflexota bacterium]